MDGVTSQIIFLFVIVFLLGYITYQDVANRREREKFQLKLMSKTPEEYVSAVKAIDEKPEPNVKDEAEIYVDTDDVPVETLLKARDLT